jgi:hypothetical protein
VVRAGEAMGEGSVSIGWRVQQYPTTYATPRSALAIHTGSRIRGVGTGGSNPLAPTKTSSSPDETRCSSGLVKPICRAHQALFPAYMCAPWSAIAALRLQPRQERFAGG